MSLQETLREQLESGCSYLQGTNRPLRVRCQLNQTYLNQFLRLVFTNRKILTQRLEQASHSNQTEEFSLNRHLINLKINLPKAKLAKTKQNQISTFSTALLQSVKIDRF